eukprot:scaffold31571_cov83-Isochrysis_galbana.AAC.4
MPGDKSKTPPLSQPSPPPGGGGSLIAGRPVENGSPMDAYPVDASPMDASLVDASPADASPVGQGWEAAAGNRASACFGRGRATPAAVPSRPRMVALGATAAVPAPEGQQWRRTGALDPPRQSPPS